jgi:hypothetical protein
VVKTMDDEMIGDMLDEETAQAEHDAFNGDG